MASFFLADASNARKFSRSLEGACTNEPSSVSSEESDEAAALFLGDSYMRAFYDALPSGNSAKRWADEPQGKAAALEAMGADPQRRICMQQELLQNLQRMRC